MAGGRLLSEGKIERPTSLSTLGNQRVVVDAATAMIASSRIRKPQRRFRCHAVGGCELSDDIAIAPRRMNTQSGSKRMSRDRRSAARIRSAVEQPKATDKSRRRNSQPTDLAELLGQNPRANSSRGKPVRASRPGQAGQGKPAKTIRSIWPD